MGTQPSTAQAPTGYRESTSVSPPYGYEERLRDELPVVTAWLRDYICRPHRDLHRKGPVCPFVTAAMKADAVRYDFCYEVTGRNGTELEEVLSARLNAFPPPGDTPDAGLDSLVVVLPDLVEVAWPVLDLAHANLKDRAVEQGLMIGQFHPGCDERSARNSAFRVSRSPLPLLAVRRMAPHDILFLHDEPGWFAIYRERFGADYHSGRMGDELMRGLYAEAERRHHPGGSH